MSLPKNPKPARKRSPVDPLPEKETKRRKITKTDDSLKKEDETLDNVESSSAPKIAKGKKTKSEAKKSVTTKGKGAKKQVKGSQGGCSSACQDDTSSLGEDNLIDSIQPQSSTSSTASIQMRWKQDELLAEIQDLEQQVARNIIKLFDEENTIPFIARYRKDMTGGMDPDTLRKAKQSYDYVKTLLNKAQNLLKQVSAQGKLNDDLSYSICCARSLVELESIGAQFKTGSKRTLAERAKELGLEPFGQTIFVGREDVNVMNLIRPDVDGLQNVQKVHDGLKHIIAEIISKHEDVLCAVKKIYKSHEIKLESTGKKIDKDSPRAERLPKYDLYLDFKVPVKHVKPYQVLAINRAESQKLVSVKINVPDSLWETLKNDCCKKWFRNGISSPFRTKLILESFDDAIHRLISPMVVRHIRSQLNETAETESINVFVQNLRNLLLTRPLRGKVVCAIDPGFKNGCKVAVVSQSGVVQQFMKIFLPQVSRSSNRDAENFRNLLVAFNCDTIALGNGTACRETEAFLNDLIRKGFFEPLKVRYTIIDEQGVSIYSCSSLAGEEFPGTDPNFISAASLARRLQDPLSELVKVEPKHLGVGMYQHDVPEKKLTAALDEVVSECVSFVGVDVNTCSIYLLKRVAGLNESKAKNIVEWRLANGPFRSRADLKKVKMIGDKTFQQCAGFIRIIPSTANVDELAPNTKNMSKQNSVLNPLDRTWIHPESYDVAIGVLNEVGLKLNDLGSDSFMKKIQETTKSITVENLAAIFGVSSVVMKLILDAFSTSTDHDMRMLSSAPLFREGVTTFESLKVGDTLSGVVRNVVHFGAFVDIGIGKDALLHNSGMKGNIVKLNDKVSVLVSKIVPEKRNINLQLISVT